MFTYHNIWLLSKVHVHDSNILLNHHHRWGNHTTESVSSRNYKNQKKITSESVSGVSIYMVRIRIEDNWWDNLRHKKITSNTAINSQLTVHMQISQPGTSLAWIYYRIAGDFRQEKYFFD